MPLRSRLTGGQKLIWHLAVMHKIKEVLGEDTDPESCDRIADLLVSDVEEIITANSVHDAIKARALPPSAVLGRLAQTMKVLYPEAAEWVRTAADGWREREIREGWPEVETEEQVGVQADNGQIIGPEGTAGAIRRGELKPTHRRVVTRIKPIIGDWKPIGEES